MMLRAEPQEEMLACFREWLTGVDRQKQERLTLEIHHIGGFEGPVASYTLDHETVLPELTGKVWNRMERHAQPTGMTQRYNLIARSVSQVILGQQPFEVSRPIGDTMGDGRQFAMTEAPTAAGRTMMGMRHDNDDHRTYQAGVQMALAACNQQLNAAMLMLASANRENEMLRTQARQYFQDLQAAQDQSTRRELEIEVKRAELDDKAKKTELGLRALATAAPLLFYKFMGPEMMAQVLPLIEMAFKKGEGGAPPRRGMQSRPQPPADPEPQQTYEAPAEPQAVHQAEPDVVGIQTFLRMIGPEKKRQLLLSLSVRQGQIFKELEQRPTKANMRALWESFSDPTQLAQLAVLLSQEEQMFLGQMLADVADPEPEQQAAE